MKRLEELSKDDWRSLVKNIPHIGEKLDWPLTCYDEQYFTNQNERIYRVRDNNETHGQKRKGLLKVSQLRMYIQSHPAKTEPINIRYNLGGNKDIYSVMFFDEPERYEDIKKVNLGIGLYRSECEQWKEGRYGKEFVSGNAIDCLVDEITRYGMPSQLWPWSNADIHIDLIKNNAELWYHGMDAGSPAVAVSRDYGLQLYKLILGVLEKDEGKIHHSYASGWHPKITDSGANNPKWINGL